jgi:hypothetical protein
MRSVIALAALDPERHRGRPVFKQGDEQPAHLLRATLIAAGQSSSPNGRGMSTSRADNRDRRGDQTRQPHHRLACALTQVSANPQRLPPD